MNPVESLREQRRLLEIEYRAEKEAFSRKIGRNGIARLVKRGSAWWPVGLQRTYYNSLNQRIVEITRTPAEDDATPDDHDFEYGRPVALFRVPQEEDAPLDIVANGTVSFTDADRMAIAVADDAVITSDDTLGVMLSFDETSYRAMFDALDRAIKGKGQLGDLRDLIYSHRRAGEYSLPPMHFSYLNPTQEEGVNKVLRAKDVAIVHGPPGTGKTTTLVEAITETLRRESQVLVCAQSNLAVDWICEKLMDRGVNVLRIGNPARVTDKMLAFTYERRFESHPDYTTLWSIRKAMRELRSARRHTDQWQQKIERLKSRATELEFRINQDLMSHAHVIASTLVGSGHRLLDGTRFSTLFIDEAAQALEAACWIAMRRAGRVILAGDHCQLPPTVKCIEAMKCGLGKSLMERIVENHPECVTLLDMQYRMNEDIMRFSSEWFYGGKMKAAPEVRHRMIIAGDPAIEWLDTSGILDTDGEADTEAFREATAGDGRINRDEALLTIIALQNYINRIGRKRFIDDRIDVGVISPYRAQVDYLRHLLRRVDFFRQLRRQITVNTVDGFQGQERDVIIVSLVRSNDDGQIGFLRDLRRMNVAMTRARMKLILIGNLPTLARHPFYRRLNDYIERTTE